MRKRLVIDVKPGPTPADADPAQVDGLPPRRVWWVEWRGFGRRDWWHLRSSAIEDARDYARQHETFGGIAQVVVHRLDGKIAREWTYGADPRAKKG